MKKLSASEYLGQLEIIDETIRQDLERLQDMKLQCTSIGAIRYDKENVQTSPSGDRMCLEVARYVDFNEQINKEIDHYVDVKNHIIQQIRALRDVHYIRVLYEMYVNGKNLKVIAAEMEKSYKFVRETHKNALAEFEKTHESLTYVY